MSRAANARGGDLNSPPWKMLSDFGASYLVEMSVATWIALPEHARRRDTERQARKEHWDAARSAVGPAFETLRWVTAGELDGQLCKVNGHTRALLWERGQLRRPTSVIAKVFRCESRAELNELYATYDTQDAAETQFDRVTGAYRECGLTLTSQRLRTGTIVDALSIAMRGFARSTERDREDEFDVYAAVANFARELAMLDSLNPQNEYFPTGIVAAALLSLAEHPHSLAFFKGVGERKGSKQAGEPDPVESVLDELRRLKRRKAGRASADKEDLCARTLGAVSAWLEGSESASYWGTPKLQAHVLPEAVQRVRALRLQQSAALKS